MVGCSIRVLRILPSLKLVNDHYVQFCTANDLSVLIKSSDYRFDIANENHGGNGWEPPPIPTMPQKETLRNEYV
jgi:hypothetical protein